MSIRESLENHAPIAVKRIPGDDEHVFLDALDLQELEAIAGRTIEKETSFLMVSVRLDDLQALMEEAHEVLHPRPGSVPDFVPDEEPESNDGDTNMRSAAVHYATTYLAAKMQAEHGLDTSPISLIEQAKEIYDFLRGA